MKTWTQWMRSRVLNAALAVFVTLPMGTPSVFAFPHADTLRQRGSNESRPAGRQIRNDADWVVAADIEKAMAQARLRAEDLPTFVDEAVAEGLASGALSLPSGATAEGGIPPTRQEIAFAETQLRAAMDRVQPILEVFKGERFGGVTAVIPTVVRSSADQPLPLVVHQEQVHRVDRHNNLIVARPGPDTPGTVLGVNTTPGPTFVHLSVVVPNTVSPDDVIAALTAQGIRVESTEASSDMVGVSDLVVDKDTLAGVEIPGTGSLLDVKVWYDAGSKIVEPQPLTAEPLPTVRGSLMEPSKFTRRPRLPRPLRVGINGVGRIGQMEMRQLFLYDEADQLQVVAVNDPAAKAKDIAARLTSDTEHGRFPGTVRTGRDEQGDYLEVEVPGKPIRRIDVYNRAVDLRKHEQLTHLPWKSHQVDVVIDAAGPFLSKEALEGHIIAGAKGVLLTAPSQGRKAEGDQPEEHGADFSLLVGVNDGELPAGAQVVDCASCTTNSYVPAKWVLGQRPLTIDGPVLTVHGGDLVTIHGYTSTQALVDRYAANAERGRAAARNMVLTGTGAGRATAPILPHLKGKLSAAGLRYPAGTGSLSVSTDVIEDTSNQPLTPERVNAHERAWAETDQLRGVLATASGVVSAAEIVGRSESSILLEDATQLIPLGGGRYLTRTLNWYDNEWGYPARLTDALYLFGAKVLAAAGSTAEEERPQRPTLAEGVQKYERLIATAAQMVPATGGILAADEGAGKPEADGVIRKLGTAGRRLASVGLPETPENRQAMRRVLLTTPGLKQAGVDAVILDRDTLTNTVAEDNPTTLVAYLQAQGIIPGLKTDEGLEDDPAYLDEKGVKRPKDRELTKLPALLQRANELGLGFTKYRTTIRANAPPEANMRENAQVQAQQAKLAQEAGLVPIVEPEVIFDGSDGSPATHDLAASYQATTQMLEATFEALTAAGVWLDSMILKTSMILAGKKAPQQTDAETVGFETLKGLLKTVPADVPAIVFLSGGQGDDQATANLDAVIRASRTRFTEARDAAVAALQAEGKSARANEVAALTAPPWQLSYSFGRGLQAKPLAAWGGKPENVTLAQSAMHATALQVQRARQGRLSEAAGSTGEGFTAVTVPDGLVPALKHHGLEVAQIEVKPLQDQEVPQDLLSDRFNAFSLSGSIAQAAGSIFFAGLGKDIKEIADGNAVFFAGTSIQYFVERNPDIAVVVLADEGARDESFSLELGSIYVDATKIGFSGMTDLLARLKVLRNEGKTILYFVGDALEKTNGLITPEAATQATDSNALFSFYLETPETRLGGANQFLNNDNNRIGGVSFVAPDDAGVTPFDVPSETLPKIAASNARAQGLVEGMAEFDQFVSDYINSTVILALGPRPVQDAKDYDKAVSTHRHQAIIIDAKALQATYPGLKVVFPGDGDLGPRVVAGLGLDLDGRHMVVFGRSGSTEARAAMVAVLNSPTARFVHSYVSEKRTSGNYSAETAYQYTNEEVGRFTETGIPPSVYAALRATADIQGTGVLALTSVTGASEAQYSPSFAADYQRVAMQERSDGSGTITTSTILSTPQGNFLVRVTLQSANIARSRGTVKRGIHAAREYWRQHEGEAIAGSTVEGDLGKFNFRPVRIHGWLQVVETAFKELFPDQDITKVRVYRLHGGWHARPVLVESTTARVIAGDQLGFLPLETLPAPADATDTGSSLEGFAGASVVESPPAGILATQVLNNWPSVVERAERLPYAKGVEQAKAQVKALILTSHEAAEGVEVRDQRWLVVDASVYEAQGAVTMQEWLERQLEYTRGDAESALHVLTVKPGDNLERAVGSALSSVPGSRIAGVVSPTSAFVDAVKATIPDQQAVGEIVGSGASAVRAAFAAVLSREGRPSPVLTKLNVAEDGTTPPLPLVPGTLAVIRLHQERVVGAIGRARSGA